MDFVPYGYTISHHALFGSTISKKAYATGEIASLNGLARISAGISFLWFLAEMGTAAMNGKRRAVHDFIAHTVVVKL